MNPKIGIRFEHEDKEGVVLQTCQHLPKHHKREEEVGPFYGVYYEAEYVWYNDADIKKLLLEAVIKSHYND